MKKQDGSELGGSVNIKLVEGKSKRVVDKREL